LGALQAFTTYQAKLVGAEKDEELEAVVRAMCLSGKKPKFIYAIPDFQPYRPYNDIGAETVYGKDCKEI
jgi:DNA-binding transcriptional MocR family regulator